LLEVVVVEVVGRVVLVVLVVEVVWHSNFIAVVMFPSVRGSKLMALMYFRYSRAVLYKWQKVGASDLKL
jgi:hypothetical protein